MLGWMRQLRRALQGPRPNRSSARRPGLELLEDRCVPTAVGYSQTFLVGDQASAGAAHTDPNMLNPAGIAFSAQGPFYVANSGSGLATNYANDGTPGAVNVIVPPPSTNPVGASTPTAIVANSTSDFVVDEGTVSAPALFLFATADGTISGWNPSVDATHAVRVVDDTTPATGPVYTGMAMGTNASGNYLFVTNFRAGTIDVYDHNFQKVALGGTTTTSTTGTTGTTGTSTSTTTTTTTTSPVPFTDPNLPSGYAPYSITNLGGKLFVTYAIQDLARQDPVSGAGNGIIDVYDTNGNFLQRFATGGALNAPRGIALAPSNFGELSKDLLVANYGDGEITAFNPSTGAYVGTLNYGNANPVIVSGLSALAFGNGSAGNPTTLYFAGGAGTPGHGLFGTLVSNDLPLEATGQNISSHPGVNFSGTVATFSDTDPTGTANNYTAIINWGDGSALRPGTVTANPNGGFSVNGTHTYQTNGTFNITISVSDTDNTHDTGGASTATTAQATVTDMPLSATGLSILPSPGTTFTGAVATFTDADTATTAPGSYTVMIDWGDGTTPTAGIVTATPVPGSANSTTANSTNTGNTGTTTGSTATTGTTTTTTTTTGNTSTTTTTTTPTGPVQFTVSGTHTYALTGNYQVKVTIVDSDATHDGGGATAMATTEATVGGDEEHYVARLYQDLLNRAPDPNGLAYWVQILKSTGSRQQVAQGIVNSTEYQADLLNSLYERLLGRSIDPLGLLVWGTDLAHGVTAGTIESDILGSNEYLALHGNDTTAFVIGLYQSVLNRLPSAGDVQTLTQEMANNISAVSIATGVVNSLESEQDEVQLMYVQFLHRPADSGGLSSYSAQLQTNSNNPLPVIASIVGSQEYHDMA